MLSGLLGIAARGGSMTADPIIPGDRDGFCATNLPGGRTVFFDRTGARYGLGAGPHIL